MLGSFTASQNATQSSHFRISGTASEIRIDPAFLPWIGRRFTLDRERTVINLEWPQVDQMTEGFEYFANCVLDGTDPHPCGKHGLVDMGTIAAIYQAAETGQEVSI